MDMDGGLHIIHTAGDTVLTATVLLGDITLTTAIGGIRIMEIIAM